MDTGMREAVQILLDRMKTNPEDFFGNEELETQPRFGWVWLAITENEWPRWGLSEAEIAAIKQGYNDLMYGRFHERVLATLLQDQDEPLSFQTVMARQGSSLKHKPYHSDPRAIYGNPAP